MTYEEKRAHIAQVKLVLESFECFDSTPWLIKELEKAWAALEEIESLQLLTTPYRLSEAMRKRAREALGG